MCFNPFLRYTSRDPLTLNKQERQDAFWACLGNNIFSSTKNDFRIERDPNSGKIILSSVGELFAEDDEVNGGILMISNEPCSAFIYNMLDLPSRKF